MIQFEDVSFSYNARKETSGVSDINLDIKEGEFVLLCGLSGCGKSTITRLINGLIPNFYEGELSGNIFLHGKKTNRLPLPDIAKQVGSVFQNPRSQFFNVDTTGELAFGSENQGISASEIKERVRVTVDILGLQHLLGRNIFQLSGGEKQRIAFGSAYAGQPEVFVLDEPSSNLDFNSIYEIGKILEQLKVQKKTIVIAEHRLYYIKDLVDKVLYMENGRITKKWTGDDFRAMSSKEREALGLRTLDLCELSGKQTIKNNVSKNEIVLHDFSTTYTSSTMAKVHALHLDDLSIPTKEVIAIIGDNGAGKSTLVRGLCGLEKKVKGIVEIDGTPVKKSKRVQKSYLVMQDVNHQLFTESVEDELVLGVKDLNSSKIHEILEHLDLDMVAEEHPMALSGGQKQRVAIAAAMACGKELIALDEPTSGLDYRQMSNVATSIETLLERAKIVLVVTHDVEFILKCCTYVIQLDNGNCKEMYPLDEKGCGKLFQYFKIHDK